MKELVYISPLRYPSDRAGSLFSMKSCEVFATENVDVELWIPWRHSTPPEINLFDYFGVKNNFKIRIFPTIDLTKFFPKGYSLLYISFALSVFFYSLYLKLFGRIKNYVFYSHEQFAIFLLTFISSKTFYEIHDFPGNQVIYRCLFKRIRGIVTTNKWKAEELAKRFSTPKHSILTVPNAVDLESFSNDLKIEEMRKKLNLPLSDYLIGYVGALKTMGMEKGLTTAILALEFLPTNYKLYIIGGDSDEDMEYYKTFANGHHFLDRVIFAGHVPHKDIPTYISACNSLIAPFPENDHYSYYMSPMKIFEYMASKRPIILTDLPSLREILKDGETALFVPPSDSKALSGAIEKVAKDNELGHRLSENAYREVREKYTWVKRAEKILTFLRQF